MYSPREDSFLIQKHIKAYAKRAALGAHVLDMGTGSGILARELARYCKDVTAVDINKKVKFKHKHVKFVHSNLFSKVKGKFDLMTFNPPYLPSEKIEDIEVDGGKNGTEITERFLKQARAHLSEGGIILLLCSSFNKSIEKMFRKYGYRFKLLDKESFFFEQLFVYELNRKQ